MGLCWKLSWDTGSRVLQTSPHPPHPDLRHPLAPQALPLPPSPFPLWRAMPQLTSQPLPLLRSLPRLSCILQSLLKLSLRHWQNQGSQACLPSLGPSFLGTSPHVSLRVLSPPNSSRYRLQETHGAVW